MEPYIEVKLIQDAYSDGFINGLTMCQSGTTQSLQKVAENEYRTAYGHKLILNETDNGNTKSYSTTFINTTDTPATLQLLSSFAFEGLKIDKVYRLQSFWSAEGKLKVETVSDLHLQRSWSGSGKRCEKFGCLGSMPVRKYFPFIAVENCERGEFTAVQLYTPYSWQMELISSREREKELFALVGGIADADFGQWSKTIAPGESFTTPKAVVAKGKTLLDVCNKLVKAQQSDISPVDDHMGVVFNEFCSSWGNPNVENIEKACLAIKDMGVQYFVIDAGWYGKEWWADIGDWNPEAERFPGGLKQAADIIRANGLIPGIWFEFENVANLAAAYHQTEHLLKRNGVPISVGTKRFWDMTDPWVQNYLTEKVIGTLKDCGFGYIKVDYNETIGVGADGADSPCEKLRQTVEGTLSFFRKIKKEIPDIVIETCSSGGHRLVPNFMELSSQASFSDAHECVYIPIIAANVHRVIRPEQSQIWAVVRQTDSENRLYYSLVSTFLGRMCLSGDIDSMPDDSKAILYEGIRFYEKVADVIKRGKTTAIERTSEEIYNPEGEQIVVRECGDKKLIIAHRFANSKAISFQNERVLASFGNLDGDFTAMALLCGANR